MTTIRPVRRDELGALADLCREHAEYDRTFEQIAPLPDELAEHLEQLIFEREQLRCHVAERDGRLLGYVSGCWLSSTWRGDRYVLMDCLYLSAGARGAGLGRALFDAFVRAAAEDGATRVRWQTPATNAGSNRFYARLAEHYPLGVADKRVYTAGTVVDG